MSLPIINYLKDKNILILGFGREGKSTLRFLRKHLPDKTLTIADIEAVTVGDPLVTVISGDGYLSSIGAFDLIIKAPGIPSASIMVPKGVEITCQLDLFLRFFGVTTVGITGTKGKTTTSTLIHAMLKSAGKNAALLGNVGVPVFDIPDGTEIAVVEMSCNQLEFTKASPHIAVLVNLYEDHLEHYKDGFDGYARAKLNITRFQTKADYFIYNPEQTDERIPDLAAVSGGTVVAVPFSKAVKDPFLLELQQSTAYLLGEHSRQNLGYAHAAVRLCGVSDDAMRAAIKAFTGIAHRLEYVGIFGGIIFYNDSIATVPTAVINAVNSIGNVSTLIFGGLDRGIDYTPLISFLVDGKIKNLVGLPETGHTILAALKESGCPSSMFPVDDMETAVKITYEKTPRGKTCLFSPAAASYNRYKNFEEKGSHFKDCVNMFSPKS